MKLIEYRFKPRAFTPITLAFIVFTILGTVSHELGHISAARILGYETTLHFGSMSWKKGPNYDEMKGLYAEYKEEIDSNSDFPHKERVDLFKKKLERNKLVARYKQFLLELSEC